MVISKTIRSAALTIRRAANVVGVDIHPHSKTKWRWSHNVETYFPVDPISRWGYGKPPHPQIAEKFERQRAEFAELLGRFSQSSEILASVPLEGDRNSSIPYWKNSFFEYLDGAALIAMLNYKAPVRYLEIGSGNSTKFARHAIKGARLSTKIISLDSEPRAQIDTLCDTTIRRRLEDSDLSLFDQLEAGDILFFDGSHRVFTNSDVTVFFLELMPRLRPGVIVHIHDIFLPWDYPPKWQKRMYSEQYMLAAMLLCPKPPFKVLLPNWFVCSDPELSSKVQSVLGPGGWRGGSFWIEMVKPEQ
jgi:hypothetical protein